ncbi:hypothetical protein BDP27DRAFT_1039719 [Rhodocollybia butyracea]|uniref:Uncharacterized protein n=1 Tax=Rhodocollybia butyracea TaxID=206335 RepID=A0A9P5Q6J5_9AGAR|nr:hypothetical protein BDP27DRAFT_1039719 [Rhodocollybia butyracea]
MPTLTTSKTGEDAANTDWPIHFESVSWAYESPTFKAKFKAPYRLSKLLQSQANDDDIGALERDLELNNELVGVAAAVDVLCAYEENSGFHYKFGGDHSEPVSDISREIDDDNVVLSRENWDDMTQNLTGDFSEDGSDSSSLASSLVLDSSDWEMPSTPKPPFLSPRSLHPRD